MITPDELEILRKPEVQAYIREKMGEIEPGDMYYICGEGPLITNFKHWPDKEEVIIPDCISRDSSRPERGLWGCLKSFIIGGMDYYPYMDATVMSDQVIVGFKCGCASIISWIGTPRLALLKALEWQIGRK